MRDQQKEIINNTSDINKIIISLLKIHLIYIYNIQYSIFNIFEVAYDLQIKVDNFRVTYKKKKKNFGCLNIPNFELQSE